MKYLTFTAALATLVGLVCTAFLISINIAHAQTNACTADPNEPEKEFVCDIETLSCEVSLRLCFPHPTDRALKDGVQEPFNHLTELDYYEASFTSSGGSATRQLQGEGVVNDVVVSVTRADVLDDSRASVAAVVKTVDTDGRVSEMSNTAIVSGRFSDAFRAAVVALSNPASAIINLQMKLVIGS